MLTLWSESRRYCYVKLIPSPGLMVPLYKVLPSAPFLSRDAGSRFCAVSKDAGTITDALCSGEEFELLFTASRDQANKIIKNRKYRFTVIGEIMPKAFGLRLINSNSEYARVKAKGFRHF